MAIIRELPQVLRDQIAAGEVVERPASVVKELVENSIDAGAKNIVVSIKCGGREEICVSDDGHGIQPEYIKTAFLPHATSKITQLCDLSNILTNGFRGEALASVASVSKLSIVTKVEEGEFALSYSIDGGIGGEVVPAARDTGTTITVQNLFYNTPARLKFLKKDASEGAAVVDAVTKLALSHCDINFKLIKDGQAVLNCNSGGDLLFAIRVVCAKDMHSTMSAVDYEEDGYKVHGYVTRSQGARNSRAMQYFFVNGRYVKDKTFTAAIDAATKDFFHHGKFAGAVLFLTLSPELVDVNVHPAKTQVRFSNEKQVFSAVYRAVKTALTPSLFEQRPFVFEQEKGGDDANSLTQLHSETAPNSAQVTHDTALHAVALSRGTHGTAPKGTLPQAGQPTVFQQAETPISQVRTGYFDSRSIDIAFDIDDTPTHTAVAESITPQTEQQPLDPSQQGCEVRLVGELFTTYIVAQYGDSMLLIDKHAAAERIIYERLMSTRIGDIPAQMLLSPLTVDVDNDVKQELLDQSEFLHSLGIELEDFGSNTVRVYSLPADIDGYDAGRLLTELAQGFARGDRSVDSRTQWVYHSVACRAAVKAGDKQNSEELLHLAKEIMSGRLPKCCPHGRPAVLSFTKKELEKQFGRA